MTRHTSTPSSDLRAAVRAGHLVSIARRPRRLAPVNGVVVSVGLRWAVLRRIHSDVVLDGYVAVPISLVSRVVEWREHDWRADEIRRSLPSTEADPRVDPTTPTTLLRSAAARYHVLTISVEGRGSTRAVCGERWHIVERRVIFRPLTTAGGLVSAGAPMTVPLHAITRLDFGDRYGRAMACARELDVPVRTDEWPPGSARLVTRARPPTR